MGTTANARMKAVKAMMGASTKIRRSAKGGIQSSLKNILTMSAASCSRPKGPTRLGP